LTHCEKLFFSYEKLLEYHNSKIIKWIPHETNNEDTEIIYLCLNMGEAVMVVLPATLTIIHSARDYT